MKRLPAALGMAAALGAGCVLLSGWQSAPPRAGAPGAGAPVTSAPGGKGGGKGDAKGGAPKGPQPLPVLVAVAVPREMRQTLEVTGTLRTDTDVQVGSRIAGRVARITVKEGDRVRRGQVLVQLDDREVRTQIARAQGTLQAAQARLSLARNQANWKDTSAKSEFERAHAALKAANARLQTAEMNAKLEDVNAQIRVETAQSGLLIANQRLSIAKTLTRQQELRQAQLAVDQAKERLSEAQTDQRNARQAWERRRKLLEKDAISKEEVEEAERKFKAAEAQVAVAQTALAVAQQKLELAAEGSRPEEVRAAEEGVRAAQELVEQAKGEQQRRKVAQDEVTAARAAREQAEAAVAAARAGLVQPKLSLDEIRTAEAAVSQAKADLALYRTQLADHTLVAPAAGVVASRAVNAGATVTSSTPLLNLVALDNVYFEAQVPEQDVAQLKPGQPAAVTADALPRRSLPGVVREVIPVADRGSRAFRVRVAVLQGQGMLPPGGFARARVAVSRHTNTVTIHRDAVKTESGEPYVWLVVDRGEKGQTVKRLPVKLGLIEKDYAEVLSGLKVGDRAVTAGSPAIIEGTPIKVLMPGKSRGDSGTGH